MPLMMNFDSHPTRWLLSLSVLIGGMAAPVSGQWTVTNLNPARATESEAHGIGGGKQVGWATFPGMGGHALVWIGSAASWVDLHPTYHSESQALGITDDGQQQVGWADLEACLWSGSAGSWVDLHPADAVYVSQAVATSGGQQVGKTFMGDGFHASLWSGTGGERWSKPRSSRSRSSSPR